MTERLNYTKAATRDQRRAAKQYDRRIGDGVERQAALQAFVDRHSVHCFRCDANTGPWAKTGMRRNTGGLYDPWAICTSCIEKRSATQG